MKFSKYFMMAGAAALLAACSSEAPDVPTPGTTIEEGEVQTYINLAINLPTEAATRAGDASNDQFEDGTANEYAVKKAHLVTFKLNEAGNDANRSQIYDLSDALKTAITDGHDYASSYYSLITGINEGPTDNVYAMVVLNLSTEQVSALIPEEYEMSKLVSVASTTLPFKNKIEGTDYFVMMNAPMYLPTATGEKKSITFTQIEPSKMFKSATLAASSPNAQFDIYVERVAAKASLTVTQTAKQDEVSIGTTKFKIGDIKWNLDVTNKSTYPVRNVTHLNDWTAYLGDNPSVNRFVSSASSRIYWAQDPNYDTNPTSSFTLISNAAVTLTEADAAYCYENTFNVANMRQDRTTRMIIKATLKKDDGTANYGSFFTVGSVAGVQTEDQLVATIKEIITGEKLSWTEGAGEDAKVIEMTDADKITVVLTRMKARGGSYTFNVGEIQYQADTESKNVPASVIAQINGRVSSINYYKDGECYYVVRLKHFGDKYCPWEDGSTEGKDADPTYGEDTDLTTASQKFLGRFGMVRNNWYEVNVNAFEKVGFPGIPDPQDKPDDENVYYINYHIHINSWAKRVQDVNL